jgi:hypothetical protein
MTHPHHISRPLRETLVMQVATWWTSLPVAVNSERRLSGVHRSGLKAMSGQPSPVSNLASVVGTKGK